MTKNFLQNLPDNSTDVNLAYPSLQETLEAVTTTMTLGTTISRLPAMAQ